MSTAPMPVVLVFVGHYLPGFKAGGILRSVENMVNHLHHEYRFMVVTRDRDLGDSEAYSSITHRAWQAVGNACVYYLEPRRESLVCICRLIRDTPHDVIYLNSFFEPLTVKALLNRRIRCADRRPIILSPRGEFSCASLRLKYPKKAVFMRLARLIGLYNPVTWHASSEFEANDITSVMRIPGKRIQIALDLPTLLIPGAASVPSTEPVHGAHDLRVAFLSRISREKNLDYALEVLSRVRARVVFDIIGPVEDVAYLGECERRVPMLPGNIRVRILGSIRPSEVISTLGRYDLLLFPSGGENYGHVIAESLTTGTPVLISTNTPWRNLEARGLGWDVPLDDMASFVRVVDEMGTAGEKARVEQRKTVKENMRQLLADPSAVESNRRLFNLALGRSDVPRSDEDS